MSLIASLVSTLISMIALLRDITDLTVERIPWAYVAWFLTSAAIVWILVVRRRRRTPVLMLAEWRLDHVRKFVGRDQEVRAVLKGARENSVVLLVGQSGVGKSAVLEAGIAEGDAVTRAGFVPVLIQSMPGDWVTGPTRSLLSALRRCAAAGGLAVQATLPGKELIEIQTLVTRISASRGLTPLLVFDQCDDYVEHHSKHFATDGVAIQSNELLRENAFWNVITKLIAGGAVHAIFASRRDRPIGLDSLVGPQRLEIHVLPLTGRDADDLLSSLEQVSQLPNFAALRKAILAELSNNDLNANSILPIQLRTVLLSLGALRVTTARAFRKIGVRALEINYVSACCQAAAKQLPGAGRTADAERVLGALVDNEGNPVAASLDQIRQTSASELSDDELKLVLSHLESQDIVKPSNDGWQLDHAYLAGPVAAMRSPDFVLRRTLQAAQRDFEAAAGISETWQALIPLPTQWRLFRAHLRGALNYAPRSLVLLSLLKISENLRAWLAVLTVLIALLSYERLQSSRIQSFVGAFDDSSSLHPTEVVALRDFRDSRLPIHGRAVAALVDRQNRGKVSAHEGFLSAVINALSETQRSRVRSALLERCADGRPVTRDEAYSCGFFLIELRAAPPAELAMSLLIDDRFTHRHRLRGLLSEEQYDAYISALVNANDLSAGVLCDLATHSTGGTRRLIVARLLDEVDQSPLTDSASFSALSCVAGELDDTSLNVAARRILESLESQESMSGIRDAVAHFGMLPAAGYFGALNEQAADIVLQKAISSTTPSRTRELIAQFVRIRRPTGSQHDGALRLYVRNMSRPTPAAEWIELIDIVSLAPSPAPSIIRQTFAGATAAFELESDPMVAAQLGRAFVGGFDRWMGRSSWCTLVAKAIGRLEAQPGSFAVASLASVVTRGVASHKDCVNQQDVSMVARTVLRAALQGRSDTGDVANVLGALTPMLTPETLAALLKDVLTAIEESGFRSNQPRLGMPIRDVTQARSLVRRRLVVGAALSLPDVLTKQQANDLFKELLALMGDDDPTWRATFLGRRDSVEIEMKLREESLQVILEGIRRNRLQETPALRFKSYDELGQFWFSLFDIWESQQTVDAAGMLLGILGEQLNEEQAAAALEQFLQGGGGRGMSNECKIASSLVRPLTAARIATETAEWLTCDSFDGQNLTRRLSLQGIIRLQAQ